MDSQSHPPPGPGAKVLDQGIAGLLANHSSAIFWTADRTLTITSVTGGGLAAFGRRSGDGIGKSLFEYFGTTDRLYPPLAVHLKALEGQAGDYEVEYRGRTFYSHVEPFRGKDGTVEGAIGLGLDVTDTVLARAALKESEERFRSIFERSPIGIGIAYKGLLQYANSTLVRLFRCDDPSDLVGKSVLSHIAPGCRDEIRRRIEDRENGHPWADSFETMGLRKDGTEFVYRLDVARIRLAEGDGTMAFATDVTALRQAQEELERRVAYRTAELAKANRQLQSEVDERKRSESALLMSEEKFRDLAENIKEVFWLVDSTNYDVLYVSPGYAEIWGRSTESLYQSPRSWMDSVHPKDRERVSKAYDQTKEGRFDQEYRIVLPDGRIRWIHDRAFPVRKVTGAVHRVAGVAEDITERKRLETEIREAINQSRQAYIELQGAQSQLVRSEKLASIGMLVSGVAHELNNPLNVIYGNLKLLKDNARAKGKKSGRAGGRTRDPEEPRKTRLMLRDALRSAERAIDIIETFRDFARDTRWAEPVDLNTLLEKTLAVIRRQLPPGIIVVKRLGRIPKFRCFPGQLTQVFFNLIQNSIEAIEKKGSIALRSSRKKDHLLIEVEDTGKGMPPEVKQRVFEPFFTTKEVGKGLGLGLSVSAMIVHNHGGEIDVESGIGKGSVFRIRFPLARTDPSARGPR